MNLNRKFEDKYFPKVRDAIKGQISSLTHIIENNGIQAGIIHLDRNITSPVAPIIQDLYLEVGLRYARIQWRQLQDQRRRSRKGRETKGFGFNEAWAQFIKDFLFRFLTETILFQLQETTRAVLIATLQKAIEEGWGIKETVKELDELSLSRVQAARIVRTEVTRASNTGHMAGASTFEYEQVKEWVAAMDLRTRGTKPEDHASHRGLDGIVVDYDDVFIDPRNGDKLRYPGDPEASAASTVNCRCRVVITAKTDEQGRLIPKKK